MVSDCSYYMVSYSYFTDALSLLILLKVLFMVYREVLLCSCNISLFWVPSILFAWYFRALYMLWGCLQISDDSWLWVHSEEGLGTKMLIENFVWITSLVNWHFQYRAIRWPSWCFCSASPETSMTSCLQNINMAAHLLPWAIWVCAVSGKSPYTPPKYLGYNYRSKPLWFNFSRTYLFSSAGMKGW